MEVPVLDPARSLVASSSAYLLAARDICKGTTASDPDWHALAQHSRDVSNALQRLLEDIVYVPYSDSTPPPTAIQSQPY